MTCVFFGRRRGSSPASARKRVVRLDRFGASVQSVDEVLVCFLERIDDRAEAVFHVRDGNSPSVERIPIQARRYSSSRRASSTRRARVTSASTGVMVSTSRARSVASASETALGLRLEQRDLRNASTFDARFELRELCLRAREHHRRHACEPSNR